MHMGKRLKVGVIGCGDIVLSVHLKILTSLSSVEVVALAEPEPRRLGEASRQAPKAIICASYEDLLKRSEVEAVMICAPPMLHAEVAVEAFNQGKHVYLEKPLATNLADAQDVLKAWRQAGVVGMIGFNYRFNPLYEAMRRQIRSGRLGSLVSTRSVFSTPVRPLPVWKQTRSSGGGVLLDLASHHVDLIRFFFDQEIRKVSVDVRSLRAEQDTAVLQLQLQDGLPIQSFFSLSAVDEDRFEIYGQAGKLTVDRYRSWDVEMVDAATTASHLKYISQKLKSFINVPYLFKKLRSPWHEPSFREALSRFISSVRGGKKASPDLLDGYRSLEVILAAEQSAQTGQSVTLAPLVMDF